MLVQHYERPPYIIDMVTMEPNEVRTFDARQSADSIGQIYLVGYTTPLGSTWPAIGVHDGWRPRSTWGKWQSADAAGTTTLRAAPGTENTVWACLSGPPSDVVKLALNGDGVLPAGYCGLVIAGSVTIGGRVADCCRKIAARNADTPITGVDAVILLAKPL